ncbi:MAG: response regulator [Deltaproteobacteria bacterium]|nr:response regulator [Deltaproteobacteria bacterium]
MLVVDDSEQVRTAATRALEKDGIAVDAVRSPTEAIAAAHRAKPELALVDLSLKGMGSLALCEAFAQDAVLKDVPIVLLAAAQDPVALALRPHVAPSAILEKPFELDALRKSVRENTKSDKEHAKKTEARSVAIDRYAERIAAADPHERGRVLNECLEHFGAAEHIVLSGDLGAISLAELFQMLTLQAQTGVLRVENHTLLLDLHFAQGRIDFVHALKAPTELLLGRVAVVEGCLTQRELDLFLRYRRPQRLLGSQLVQLGYLRDEELRSVLARQSSELVYELLRQRQGRFAFTRTLDEAPPHAFEVRLGLSTDALLMEGYRRVDELLVIEEKLGPRETVLDADEHAIVKFGHQNLTEEEQILLGLVNGRSTLAQILSRSPIGTFDSLKSLYRLCEAKLVRKV